MTKAIHPFTSNRALEGFAETFLKNRIQLLRKDVGICLQKNAAGRHAYFPALMSCISFLDLMSGLYVGKLKFQGLPELVQYVETFVNTKASHYGRLELAVAYEAFRHKLAHLGHPYVVFDTATMSSKTKKLIGCDPAMRLTWTVNKKGSRANPIEIKRQVDTLRKTLTPWPVAYDHRIFISIERIKKDAIESVLKHRGYLARIRNSKAARENFAGCMREYYSR